MSFASKFPLSRMSNPYLLLAREGIDLGDFESLAARMKNENVGTIWFDLEKLDKVLGGQFELFSLRPGHVYYFDTDNIHTLINAGDNERVTLSLDLIMNDWLGQWMRTGLVQQVAPSSVQRTSSIDWEWNALKNGVIRND